MEACGFLAFNLWGVAKFQCFVFFLYPCSYGRNRQSVHTAKLPDSKNCSICCVCKSELSFLAAARILVIPSLPPSLSLPLSLPLARNPYTDQRFLIAVVPKGILLLQWYQPMNTFKHVQVTTQYYLSVVLGNLETWAGS